MTGQFQKSLVLDLNPVQMAHLPALMSKEDSFMEDEKKFASTSLILIQW
jgi:hypothetical protein